MQHQLPDHRGLWKIEPPKDMPIEQIAMLQGIIRAAWRDYPGEVDDPQEFWEFLITRVPRETSGGDDASAS
jgi:hypothetical protein